MALCVGREGCRRECPTGVDMAEPERNDAEPVHCAVTRNDVPEVTLFADTFTTWFEPENARTAARVLEAAGFRMRATGGPPDGLPARARRRAFTGGWGGESGSGTIKFCATLFYRLFLSRLISL